MERKRRLLEEAIPVAERDALAARLADELPEARVIKRVIDSGTSRVITFQLVSEEASSR